MADKQDSFQLTESRKVQRARAFFDPETPATVLLFAFIDTYGGEGEGGLAGDESCLEWTPTAIRAQLEEDFARPFPRENLDKLLAAIYIIKHDDFFTSARKFMPMANALMGDVDFETLDIADVDECAWAVAESMLLSQEDSESPFSAEVQTYIAQRLEEEGFLTPPQALAPFVDYNRSDRVDSGDPLLSEAVWLRQRELADEIDEMVAARMLDLARRLKALPLQHGDSKNVVAAIEASYAAPYTSAL